MPGRAELSRAESSGAVLPKEHLIIKTLRFRDLRASATCFALLSPCLLLQLIEQCILTFHWLRQVKLSQTKALSLPILLPNSPCLAFHLLFVPIWIILFQFSSLSSSAQLSIFSRHLALNLNVRLYDQACYHKHTHSHSLAHTQSQNITHTHWQ